ncbi:AAA family ATPase [Streptococcus gallolyticus]|uniref:AAA family ATPase n=1 Tax=Streptococcus gallolyticus TaxID=315405 RepID=UPI0022B6401B|nr:AAA family ATPase [Streptococcus gallolyticus]WAW97848.1 hypothetical protein OIY87_06915 [Streptococcus gallolyticus]
MFKIKSLELFGGKDSLKSYVYHFKEGINFFKANNSKGKTLFYDYIDYMLGGSFKTNREGLEGISRSEIVFEYDNQVYYFARTTNQNENYIREEKQVEYRKVDLREYKERLNAIFSKNRNEQRKLQEFMEENVSYRQFTMFNFLGENRQGKLNNFWDKASDLKYSIRVPQLMNYFFNPNLGEISRLFSELSQKKTELKEVEFDMTKYKYLISEINSSLNVLGLNLEYNEYNKETIKQEIDNIKNFRNEYKINPKESINDLLIQLSNIDERIKVYEYNQKLLNRDFKTNSNRKKMLDKLDSLINDNPGYNYLVTPLNTVLKEIENNQSFTEFLVSNDTYEKLIRARKEIVNKLKRLDSGVKMYSFKEKERAIIKLEGLLENSLVNQTEDANKIRKRIRELQKELKKLQNQDDNEKINSLSESITELYFKAKDYSTFVNSDNQKNYLLNL